MRRPPLASESLEMGFLAASAAVNAMQATLPRSPLPQGMLNPTFNWGSAIPSPSAVPEATAKQEAGD